MSNRLVLSRKDFQIYKALKTVPERSLLSEVIQDFLKQPKVSRFIELKQTLIDQAGSDPINTRKAIGDKCFDKIMEAC